ncbi:MAG: hypothetical protein WD990_06345 [Acidimicrobiia bacterium]
MNRLRRSLDELTPSQRVTLGLLTVLVVVAAAVAVAAASSRIGDDTVSSETTLSPVTSTPPTSEATTVPTIAGTTTSTTTSPTTTTTSEASTTTSSTTAPVATVALRADGVDGWYFGDDASEVFDGLRETLGDPDEDTGWVDQQENYGICIGEEVRFVRWGSFQAFFTDGLSDWGPAGVRHFASYTQAVYFEGETIEAATTDGLALGSPVGDIRALYGEESVFDDLIYGPVFFYDPPGAAQQWGNLSGLAPDDTIESITSGFACGE